MRSTTRTLCLLLIIGLSVSSISAQTAEITITLNEPFFDAIIDAIFQYAAPPEFPISMMERREAHSSPYFKQASFSEREPAVCNEFVKILRENKNVRTSVRFREGKIVAPIAFTGYYSPPLIGCVQFSGSAEAYVTLDFDAQRKIVTGTAKISNVSLDGTGGIGGSIVARMVQGSIDKKVNPIQILDLNDMSFIVPIPNSGKLALKATGIRSEVVGNALNIYVQLAFQKA
jgi:hypothetical protein